MRHQHYGICIPRQRTAAEADAAGYDAGLNGPNTTNCDFTLFQSPETTEAWERGNERAKRETK